MSETTVGLPDNNLFGNLIANTRPSANNPGSQTLNINSIQSDTKAGDVQDIENVDDVPFQEILGLHIFNLNIHDTPNSHVPNTPAVESADIELAEESVTETNPSALSEQKSNTIQPADFLQKTFIPYPESTMQGLGNNLSPNRGKTAGSANVNIYNPFAGANNGHPSISPFVPLSQRESRWGFEEQTGINVILERHLVETHNSGSIFSLEKSNVNAVDEMDKPFIQDMDVRNPLPKADTLKLNPLNNTEITQISVTSSLNNMQQSDLYSSDSSEINMKELPETYKQLAQNISPENKNSVRTPVISGSSKNTTEQHTEIPQISGSSSLNNMQQSDLYSSDSSEINMKELSETYKLLAQNISSENKNSMRTPVISGSSKNTTEQHTESGLSKINGTVSSRQDVSSISQTNEEWNPFDSHTQKQNASDTFSFDAHIQKTNNGSPFSLDSQTTISNTQSNITDFQQNTQTYSNNSTALSSSIDDAKTVNHMFRSNDVSGVEHAQENIMEQIFQKIRITTHGDRSEIKLSLNPPELGNIKIHFMEENDEIEAKIYVENAEVKAAIEKNAHHLKESVAANGIEIHKLEVYIQNDDANKQKLTEYFDAYNPHHHNQSHSQKGDDEDQILSKEDIPGNLQTETSASTSNLMVDYLI